jgi:hypothetical protein
VIVILIVVVIILGLFLLNLGRRRHGEPAPEEMDPSWRGTDERFVDPSTGRHMRVFLDRDGGRHYLPER